MREKLITAKEKGYYADECGKIYSSRGNEIFQRKHKSEYTFTISVGGKRVTLDVHKFIGYLKFGDNIFKPGMVVIHLNGDVSDNRMVNISYGTRSDAMMCMPEEKRHERANKAAAKNRKFTDDDIKNMVKYRTQFGLSYSEIAQIFKTSKSSVSYIFNNSTSAKKIINGFD